MERLAAGAERLWGWRWTKRGGSWVTHCFGLAGAPQSASASAGCQLNVWAGQNGARRVLPRMPPSLQPAWLSSPLPCSSVLSYSFSRSSFYMGSVPASPGRLGQHGTLGP